MKRYFLLSAGFFLLLMLSHCGTARRGVPMFSPINLENPAVAKGEKIFMAYCQKCHPGGTAGLAPAINNKPVPGFLIRFQIRNGLGMMPAFKEEVISDEELDYLMAYINELRKTDKKDIDLD
ncbi:cbb3-type cytochrome c oxidase subunit III [Pontibacter ummariensis]|uniref:Cytochrome C oxidase, cbb3-type, subunit III n=1 Tax=Pontibacter ummariensis TaxID=1610492 RepID=A0A239HB31_9BACT|nr:cytochrome c [Pontibacter ummariensis]PRY10674.1 cbb3-type cytochrome c oxidase subunit III [Pontibacter ummariensis]SNS78482.1 Cytochrome C oxidase, cbb3-type, subunit III [Pontibacter ummariensis]